MTEKGETCTAEVFDYETWKVTTETNVLWKSLHLEMETLPWGWRRKEGMDCFEVFVGNGKGKEGGGVGWFSELLGENGWELSRLSFILCILFNKQFIDLNSSSRISQNSAFSANSSHDFGIASFNSFNSSRYRIYQSFPLIKQSHSQSQTCRFRLLSTSESLLSFSLSYIRTMSIKSFTHWLKSNVVAFDKSTVSPI